MTTGTVDWVIPVKCALPQINKDKVLTGQADLTIFNPDERGFVPMK
jgi:hypothetical protein